MHNTSSHGDDFKNYQRTFPRNKRGQRIAIDFDGVIHDYNNGFQGGVIYGEIIPGAFETMQRLYDLGYDICILTTRGTEPDLKAGVEKWVAEKHQAGGFTFEYEITGEKLPAIVYIDDRAIRFTNWADVRKYFD